MSTKKIDFDDDFAIRAFCLYYKKYLTGEHAFNLPKWYTEALSRVGQEEKDRIWTEEYEKDNECQLKIP